MLRRPLGPRTLLTFLNHGVLRKNTGSRYIVMRVQLVTRTILVIAYLRVPPAGYPLPAISETRLWVLYLNPLVTRPLPILVNLR